MYTERKTECTREKNIFRFKLSVADTQKTCLLCTKRVRLSTLTVRVQIDDFALSLRKQVNSQRSTTSLKSTTINRRPSTKLLSIEDNYCVVHVIKKTKIIQ